jgi:SAM-dependent methyltransferase
MLNNDDKSSLAEGARERAYGQGHQPSMADRCGIWLSARQIRRYAGPLAGKHLGDLGCGYNATFVRSALPELGHAVLVDLALSPELKNSPKVTAIEGVLPEALSQVRSGSLDILVCINVLEHLWDPHTVLQECVRVVRPGGTCIFNVPSWRGKRFLEYSAFRLGQTPKCEIDDHKAYYDVKDFWPILVRAGFRPSNIQCFRHKFGLNTFAACRV